MRRDILLNIDIAKAPGFNREFTVRNGDSLRLNVCMFQAGKILRLENQVIRAYVRKSDGSLLMQKEEIDIISENEFQVLLKNSATNVSGLCYMELEIQDPENPSVVIATNPILFEVEDRIGDVENAILAVDDLYLVGEIEKFIEESKVAMEDIRSLIQQSQEDVEVLDGKIEDFKVLLKETVESTMESIQNIGDSAIEDITTLSDEAIQNIDKLTGNCISLISDEKDKSLEEISDLTANSTKEISDEVAASMESIGNLTEQSITSIADKASQEKADIAELAEEKKAMLESHTEEKIEAISSTVDEKLAEIESKAEEKKTDFINTADEKLNVINTKSEEAINAITVKTEEGLIEIDVKSGEEQAKITALAQEKLEIIAEANVEAGEKIEAINELIVICETMATTLDTKSSEGRAIIDGINTLIERCNAIKANLEAENVKAEANTGELTTLNPQADIRIDELKSLIEQAKHYEQVVRAWIAEREPAEDLTQVNAQLEELYQAVGVIEAQFNNYYTKEETNELIADINIDTSHLATKEELDEAISGIEIPDAYTKEEVDEILGGIEMPDISELVKKDELEEYSKKGFKGAIGLATKFATLPKVVEDAIPEVPAPPIEEGEYVGKVIYKYSYSTTADRYKVLYVYNNPTSNYYPYLYLDNNGTENVIKADRLSSSYKTLKGFYTTVGGSLNFIEDNSYSQIYEERPTSTFYYSDLPIYSDINKSGIYRNASGGEFIGNFDLANEEGRYSVNLTEEQFSKLQNAPKVKTSSNRVDTVLHCYRKENSLFQEIVIEGITYTRRLGEQWTGIDTSSFIKKDAVGIIKGTEAVSEISEIDDIFASCPVPDTHQDVVGITDFRADIDKYCRYYTYKSSGNEMFYLFDNGKNSYYGYTGTRYYYVRYVYTNGAWAVDTSTYVYVSSKNEYFEIYQNTLPVCYGSGTTSYDKTNIIKEATTGNELKAINDFNEALTDGRYTVSCGEDEVINNSPVNGFIEAVLEVKANTQSTSQELILSDNTTYKRVLSNGIWTAWTSTDKELDEIKGQLGMFGESFASQIKTYTQLSDAGATETYRVLDLNGLKFMFIEYDFSDDEYNGASSGMFYKTFNIPEEAQVFNAIFIATQTSNARSTGENHLSRIMQNTEIVSNTTVRVRYRHDELTKPYIGKVRVMCIGI